MFVYQSSSARVDDDGVWFALIQEVLVDDIGCRGQEWYSEVDQICLTYCLGDGVAPGDWQFGLGDMGVIDVQLVGPACYDAMHDSFAYLAQSYMC